MKKTLLMFMLAVLFFNACTSRNYLSPELVTNQSTKKVIDDFVKYVKRNYIPANTTFAISSSSKFNEELIATLQSRGYAVCSQECYNAIPIEYIIDTVETNYVRVSFYVGSNIISRLYSLTTQGNLRPYGPFTVIKNITDKKRVYTTSAGSRF
jgi:hypothetical protein